MADASPEVAPLSHATTTRAEPVPPVCLTGDVLVATDESDLATNAARVALAIARRCGLRVQVVRAPDTRGVALPPPLDVAIGLGDELVGQHVHASCAAARLAHALVAPGGTLALVHVPLTLPPVRRRRGGVHPCAGRRAGVRAAAGGARPRRRRERRAGARPRGRRRRDGRHGHRGREGGGEDRHRRRQLRDVFHTVPIDLREALAIGAVASLVPWVEELRKLVVRQRGTLRGPAAAARDAVSV